ncbi:MAG: hypothetical protein ACRC0X_02235 [Brevinema sp.]
MKKKEEIFQDKITMIAEISKLDGLRFSQVGYGMFYLVLSIPQEKVKRPVYVPCTIYGKKAEELQKKIHSGEISQGDLVYCEGSHIVQYRDQKACLEVKLSSIERYTC